MGELEPVLPTSPVKPVPGRRERPDRQQPPAPARRRRDDDLTDDDGASRDDGPVVDDYA